MIEGLVLALRPRTADVVLRSYFHAKDENRPHLLDGVFTENATLEVHNASTAIAFPAATLGREKIADVLVRSFGQAYENVYSFCLRRPRGMPASFECEWLVAMTEKGDSRRLRLGCGRYLWEFDTAPPNLAHRLVIDILEMQVLPTAGGAEAFAALERLSYPWSSRAEVAAVAASHPVLAFIARRLAAQ